eukprot:610932_1
MPKTFGIFRKRSGKDKEQRRSGRDSISTESAMLYPNPEAKSENISLRRHSEDVPSTSKLSINIPKSAPGPSEEPKSVPGPSEDPKSVPGPSEVNPSKDDHPISGAMICRARNDSDVSDKSVAHFSRPMKSPSSLQNVSEEKEDTASRIINEIAEQFAERFGGERGHRQPNYQ